MENPSPLSQSLVQDANGEFVICVRGRLEPSWLEYYQDISISVTVSGENAVETTLRGRAADQTALLGILMALHHFGLMLLSVEWSESMAESGQGTGVTSQAPNPEEPSEFAGDF